MPKNSQFWALFDMLQTACIDEIAQIKFIQVSMTYTNRYSSRQFNISCFLLNMQFCGRRKQTKNVVNILEILTQAALFRSFTFKYEGDTSRMSYLRRHNRMHCWFKSLYFFFMIAPLMYVSCNISSYLAWTILQLSHLTAKSVPDFLVQLP